MGAKKASAAVSVAGCILVAGCAGGGGHAAIAPGGLIPRNPSNGPKISLTFSIPRAAPSYLTVSPHASAFGKSARRNAQSYRPTPKLVRKPKYIGAGVLGGYILLDIYQNGQQASSQTFTVGFSNAYADFSCYFAPPQYQSMSCYNTVNIYAPGGNDTFYAATYDSQNRLISLTPGFPGTNVYGTAPAPVTIPSSSAVQIQTYGVPYALYVDDATPCVPYQDAFFHIADVDNDIMVGPLAYPITVGAGGGFAVTYLGQSLGSSFTFYNAPFDFYDLQATSPGSGSLAAQTPGGSLPVNFPTLYGVDQTAFVASTGGLYALGLVYGSSSSYPCGQVLLQSLYTNQPLTFTNPVGMSQDGGDAIVVLDDTAGGPVVDIIEADGLFISPSVVPVAQVTLSSTVGDDIAATANLQAYVVNTDGTIHRVDYAQAVINPFAYDSATDTVIASGFNTPAGSGIGAFANGDDYVFASSYGSWLYEVDTAYLGTPTVGLLNLDGVYEAPDENFTSALVSSAVTTDASNLYADFRVFDTGVPSSFFDAVIVCSLNNGTPCINNVFANSVSGSHFGGVGTLAVVPSVPAVFVTNGSAVSALYEQSIFSGAFTFGTTWTPSPNRVVTSPDGSFVGLQLGTSFYFAPLSTQTAVGSLSGAVSTIWNFGFF